MPFNVIRSKYVTNMFTQKKREIQKVRFGSCVIEVPPKSIFLILTDEVLNPFYIFQIFACAVFFWEDYVIYAYCILGISALSIIMTVYETNKNNE